MARRARPELPAGVNELRDRIDHWRQTRERRTTMPPELWAAAVALARRHGVYRVAHGAGVNFDGLRRRIAETAGRGTTASPPAAFVELSGAQLPPSAEKTPCGPGDGGALVRARAASDQDGSKWQAETWQWHAAEASIPPREQGGGVGIEFDLAIRDRARWATSSPSLSVRQTNTHLR
jgi:hypothetical protein